MEDLKKRILEKATQLYLRYGIKSVTMDDVARHLGISKKTLYTVVKDKNELVSLSVDFQLETHGELIVELSAQNLSALEEVYEVYKWVSQMFKDVHPSYQYDLNKYYPLLCENFLKNKMQQIFDSMKTNLMKGIQEGIYREEINVDIIAKMHAIRHQSIHENLLEEMMWLSNEETFEELFLYHIHAVLNDKGREELRTKKLFSK